MSRARFAPLAAALTLGAVALAGCGSSDGTSSGGASDAPAASGPLAQVTVEGTDPAKEPMS